MTQTDLRTMVTNPNPILSFFAVPCPYSLFLSPIFTISLVTPPVFFPHPHFLSMAISPSSSPVSCPPSRHPVLLLGCQFVLSLEAESVSKENDFRQQTIKAWNLAKGRKREINEVNKRRKTDQEMLTDGKMSKWRKTIRKWKEDHIKSWMR